MKNILYTLITFVIILSSCTSSNSYPDDFTVSYSSKSYLMGQDAKVEIIGNRLSVKFSDKNMNNNFNSSFTLTEAEVDSLYQYITKNSLYSVKEPKKEMKTDSPEINLYFKSDSRSNSLNLTNAINPDTKISSFISMINNMAAKYEPKWKDALGL